MRPRDNEAERLVVGPCRRVGSDIEQKFSAPPQKPTCRDSAADFTGAGLGHSQHVLDPLGGDRHDVVITELSDEELVVIAAGGRTEDEMKVIPPMPSKD